MRSSSNGSARARSGAGDFVAAGGGGRAGRASLLAAARAARLLPLTCALIALAVVCLQRVGVSSDISRYYSTSESAAAAAEQAARSGRQVSVNFAPSDIALESTTSSSPPSPSATFSAAFSSSASATPTALGSALGASSTDSNATSGGLCCVVAGEDRECVRAGTRLAFRDNALCERGTTVAVFDYADAWERLACGVAWISSQDSGVVCPAHSGRSTEPAFRARFENRIFITDRWWSNVDADLKREGINTLYQIMAGDVAATGTLPRCVRNVVHAVFTATTPHGDGYAAVSPEVPAAPGVPVVLHITKPLPLTPGDNLRAQLGIGESEIVAASASQDRGASVFCRHGGATTFDIPWVRSALCALFAERAADAARPWFLFLNTAPLECAADVARYGRVVYLPGTSDPAAKARFMATCDACIHARASGETFGLAVAECANAGLPVITHGGRGLDGDYHLRTLGGSALTYFDGAGFRALLDSFEPRAHRSRASEYQALYSASSEARVMIDFIRAFRPDAPGKC